MNKFSVEGYRFVDSCDQEIGHVDVLLNALRSYLVVVQVNSVHWMLRRRDNDSDADDS